MVSKRQEAKDWMGRVKSSNLVGVVRCICTFEMPPHQIWFEIIQLVSVAQEKPKA